MPPAAADGLAAADGDAVGAALAGALAGGPVAHVEAGRF
jgi:hypothetical protein